MNDDGLTLLQEEKRDTLIDTMVLEYLNDEEFIAEYLQEDVTAVKVLKKLAKNKAENFTVDTAIYAAGFKVILEELKYYAVTQAKRLVDDHPENYL